MKSCMLHFFHFIDINSTTHFIYICNLIYFVVQMSKCIIFKNGILPPHWLIVKITKFHNFIFRSFSSAVLLFYLFCFGFFLLGSTIRVGQILVDWMNEFLLLSLVNIDLRNNRFLCFCLSRSQFQYILVDNNFPVWQY